MDGVVWGLIADVHGNYPALAEALTRLERGGATRLAFLGDYLGRGESDRCVQRIREVADIAIVEQRGPATARSRRAPGSTARAGRSPSRARLV